MKERSISHIAESTDWPFRDIAELGELCLDIRVKSTKPLRFLCVSLLLVLLALGHQSVSAQTGTLLSNLANTATGTIEFLGKPVRQSFFVGSSDATIRQFQIALGNWGGPIGYDPFSVKARLLSDSGSFLADFSYGGSPLALSNATPNFNGNFNVTANTRYWIEIATTGWGYGAQVRTTSDSSETGFAGWSIADSSQFWTGEPSGPSIKMNIYGTAVPEPSALSLLAIGLGGLAVMRRRRS